MVNQVGLSTSVAKAPVYNNLPQLGNSNNFPVFGMNNLSTAYDDDIMMSNIDFSKDPIPMNMQTLGTVQPQGGGITVPTNELTLGELPEPPAQAPAQTTGELDGYLVQRDKNVAYTENGNRYVKSNVGKASGAVLGFLAPMAGKIVELFKGGKFKELFKFKQLAIACPAIAVAGFGIGALLDGFINSKKAAAADGPQTPTQTQIAQQPIQPQNLNAVA